MLEIPQQQETERIGRVETTEPLSFLRTAQLFGTDDHGKSGKQHKHAAGGSGNPYTRFSPSGCSDWWTSRRPSRTMPLVQRQFIQLSPEYLPCLKSPPRIGDWRLPVCQAPRRAQAHTPAKDKNGRTEPKTRQSSNTESPRWSKERIPMCVATASNPAAAHTESCSDDLPLRVLPPLGLLSLRASGLPYALSLLQLLPLPLPLLLLRLLSLSSLQLVLLLRPFNPGRHHSSISPPLFPLHTRARQQRSRRRVFRTNRTRGGQGGARFESRYGANVPRCMPLQQHVVLKHSTLSLPAQQ